MSSLTPARVGFLAAAVLPFLAIAIQTERLERSQADVTRAAQVADTLAASLAAWQDTTRALALKVAVVADSLQAVERHAQQADARVNALTHALSLEQATQDSLAATIVGYQGTVSADTTRNIASDTARDTARIAAMDTTAATRAGGGGVSTRRDVVSESVRRGAFDIRQPPYTVHADVTLPQSPAVGTMALGIRLDTLRFTVRLGCGPPGSAGVRPAALTVTGPPWASIQIDRVDQSPDVCAKPGFGNPPSTAPPPQ